MKISDKILELAKSIDRKLSAQRGYTINDMCNYLKILEASGQVEVGWRESCGKTDATMKVYREWKKVVAALRKDGIRLNEERKKHDNSYATLSGGFWNSIIYSAAN